MFHRLLREGGTGSGGGGLLAGVMAIVAFCFAFFVSSLEFLRCRAVLEEIQRRCYYSRIKREQRKKIEKRRERFLL